MSCLNGSVESRRPVSLFTNWISVLQGYPSRYLGEKERWYQPTNRTTQNKCMKSRSSLILLIWVDSPQSFGFAAGDVYWPGGQGYLEVAPPLLPSRCEPGEESDYWIWNAIYACHGGHCHFLHLAHLHHGQIPGKATWHFSLPCMALQHWGSGKRFRFWIFF